MSLDNEQEDVRETPKEWVRWVLGREPGTYTLHTSMGFVLENRENTLLVQDNNDCIVEIPKNKLDHTYWGTHVPHHLKG